MNTVTKECLSHMLRKGMRRLRGLSPFRPVLNADARNYSDAQAQSQHPVKWDECDVTIYIYKKTKNAISRMITNY